MKKEIRDGWIIFAIAMLCYGGGIFVGYLIWG